MQHEHDDAKEHDRRAEDDRDPGNPVARVQVQLAAPAARVGPAIVGLVRVDDDLRVGDEALDVDEVLGLPPCRADEEVLDVVVRSAEAKVRVRRAKREVRRLRQLADWRCEYVRDARENGKVGSTLRRFAGAGRVEDRELERGAGIANSVRLWLGGQ